MKKLLLSFALGAGCVGATADTDTDIVVGCESTDADGDGSNACDDCDDFDVLVYPNAAEICNGLDDNCDDELAWGEEDLDSDGVLDCQLCDTMGFWEYIIAAEEGELANQLFLSMDNHECRDYSEATTYMFINLDKVEGEVEGVYTGRKVAVSNDKPDGNDMNTEHTWPQSSGADTIPARCDLNHLFPTDALANTKRGSSPFGEVVSGVKWSEGGSSLGDNASGELVFEPRDSHKGNVARAILYFEFRYSDRLTLEEVDSMLSDERRAMFYAWHLGDLPTDYDRDRSSQIGAYMGGGNPLVVCPGVLDLLIEDQLGALE
jgi:endonuclease I